MSHVRGILVRLKTKSQSGAGTDDHIYIGVVGSGGGREFPLDVRGFNDFREDQDITYWFGSVWDEAALEGVKRPYRSEPGERNDPDWFRIELDQLQTVYVRKQGDRSVQGDDAFKMDEVEVTLYGVSPEKRTFGTSNDLWLGNEYGHQAWLPERYG